MTLASVHSDSCELCVAATTPHHPTYKRWITRHHWRLLALELVFR
jgi:hypothetical protein